MESAPGEDVAEEEIEELDDRESDASESDVRERQMSASWSGTVDVSSTMVNIGRAFGDVGTRSIALTRMSVPAHDDTPGDAVALSDSSRRYEYLRVLGRGGMGQVEQVWDHDLMRKLAVKRLRPERSDSGTALRQFLWEARVTAYLDHPNIVPVHDLGMDEHGELYFTMKFVHGTSLGEVLSALGRVEKAHAEGREPAPVDDIITAEHRTQLRRVRLFLDVCQAIAYAHERGVLHRDLKPANVMLGQYGEVVIMDWGLAYPLPGPAGEGLRELLPDALPENRPNRTSGTPRYMSPEQASGESLDERSDIYSLGVILYEILALRSPYSATDFTRLLLQVTEGDVQPLTSTGPSVPDALAEVVNRAMARQPEERYATVRELADDIEAVLDGFAPAPRPQSGGMSAAQRRRPQASNHTAMLVGAGVSGGLAFATVMPSLVASLGWVATVGLAATATALGVAASRSGLRRRPS